MFLLKNKIKGWEENKKPKFKTNNDRDWEDGAKGRQAGTAPNVGIHSSCSIPAIE